MTHTTLLAVDGNSLVHRSFHALISSGLTTRDGRPTWAVKGFVNQLLNAIERVNPDAVVVGFDDHTHSVRKVAHPHYKATRSPKPPELGQQIQLTADLLRKAGIHVVVPAGLEADDVLASAAATAAEAGWRTVIVTSDRDSFALIDDTTNVLRVINGGIEASPILTRDRLRTMIDIDSSQYRQYAAMRGDTSDNLAGIRGIGEKTAAKILNVFGTVEEAFADIDSGGTRVATEVGKAVATKLANVEGREAFFRNVEIMTMYTNIDLGLDLTAPGAGLLPLEEAKVNAALDELELASLKWPAGRLLVRKGEGISTPQPPAEVYAHVPDFSDVPDAPEPYFEEYLPNEPVPVMTVAAMAGSSAPKPAVWNDSLF